MGLVKEEGGEDEGEKERVEGSTGRTVERRADHVWAGTGGGRASIREFLIHLW